MEKFKISKINGKMILTQGCHRVLVSLFSWPGQLLSLNPCQDVFFGILSLTLVILEIIKAKKGFIEDQNQLQKTALAKGEMMKTAEALRHNLRAAEMARTTVERESKELNDLQEQLARHMGKKPKKSVVFRSVVLGLHVVD